MQKHIDMPIASLVSSWTMILSLFSKWKWSYFLSKIAQFSRKSTFLHLLLQSIKKIDGKIDQIFFYYQLEQQKLFNLITNFIQIGPSKAKICSNLWKMSKLPLNTCATIIATTWQSNYIFYNLLSLIHIFDHF